MLFNSYTFIFIFLPITLYTFFKIGRSCKQYLAIVWLLFASFFFYSWWNPTYLPLLISSIVFNYAVGTALTIGRKWNELYRRSLLTLGVVVNLTLIGYFKYYNFFVDSINYLIGTNIEFRGIILPLAISFFTFQQIAYLIDAYRGETEGYNFLHYCTFVSFFPQLIAGPIVHHKEILPQFLNKDTYKLDNANIAVGITIFMIGMFKKVVIADTLALHANPVFRMCEQSVSLSFFTAWEGAIAYSLQLYFDFSGYSDMAIGLGRMFGIKLPLNFNSPYKAVNIIDFWRRWHITLSIFLREYLYISLGGNRKGPARRYINLMITMLLGGLWHGAGWTFVIWGGLHGIYLIINHIWHKIWPWHIGTWWSFTAARFLTFIAVTLGWVFFRAESLQGALAILRGMLNLPHTFHERIGPLEGLLTVVGFRFEGIWMTFSHYMDFVWLGIWLTLLWAWPNTQEWIKAYEPVLNTHQMVFQNPASKFWDKLQWKPNAVWGIVIGVIAVLSILHLSQPSEFLYFQF